MRKPATGSSRRVMESRSRFKRCGRGLWKSKNVLPRNSASQLMRCAAERSDASRGVLPRKILERSRRISLRRNRGPEGNDASIRPNQIYAVALCNDQVTEEQAEQILRI